MRTRKELILDELCYEVNGCAFEAFKTVGIGFDEYMYHQIFHDNLLKKGISAEYKTHRFLNYHNVRIAEFEIDEIVDHQLIVELKSLQTDFLPENFAQILTYQKLTQIQLGLLMNFGLHKAYSKRIIFEDRRNPPFERWDKGFFAASSVKNVTEGAINSLRNVNTAFGPAYHNEVYIAAVKVEFQQNHFAFNDEVFIIQNLENFHFKPFQIDFGLLEERLLVAVLAGKDKPRAYDFLRMRTYLQKLSLHHGLIAFWSTKNFQLYGIHVA